MKKLVALLVILTFAFALCACAAKRCDKNNIFELYDKAWIVGKSREQIEDKYGEFKQEFVSGSGENLGSYYVNYENSGIDPSHIHDTYIVLARK